MSNADQVFKFMELTLITIRQGETINKVDQQMVRIISQRVICAMKKTKDGAVMEGARGWWLGFRLGHQVSQSLQR